MPVWPNNRQDPGAPNRSERHRRHPDGKKTDHALAALVERSPDILTVVDAGGVLRYSNGAAETVLGHPRGSFAGRPIVDVLHPDDRERAQIALAELVHAPLGTRAQLRLRALTGDGQVVFLDVVARTEIDDPAVAGVIVTARDCSESVAEERALSRRLAHDELTGAFTRVEFLDRLERAIAASTCGGSDVGVLYIDVDGFKAINDEIGHAAGDEVLAEVALRLQGAVRDGDLVARFGGDEFVVLLPDLDGRRGLAEVADRVVERVKVPMAGPAARRVSVSVGGALGPGTPPDLIRSADAALLRAKRLGRDRAALTGADELGRAASGVQVVAHLDHDGQWHGAEVFGAATMALGPRLDLVADTVAGWDAQGLLPAGFVVGVRLRAIDVGRRLTSHLTGLFERQAVDPSRLCIELAEDRLAHLDLDTLTMVRRLGVGIGVRDFGLGVASYERLQSLGVARLRTHDRIVSWGSERPHRDAMNLLVRVAGALGAELVVSGVERPAQLDDLRRLGVQRVTGSLVGAPVPLEHFGPALASRRPW